MQIIPAIDIRDGKCVRLHQGNFDMETIYEDNPVAIAMKWKKLGAKIIHIVDLDGAKFGKPVNYRILKKISHLKIPIQFGGGLRNIVSIIRITEIGVDKIILGTIALKNEKLIKKVINLFKEKIIVSLDANNQNLVTDGWQKNNNNTLFPEVKKLESFGLKTIIYTDTNRDGTLIGPNYENIRIIRKIFKLNLIVAGGISSINQIKKLKGMKIDGVIIGKALYEGKINLKEAIRLC